MIAKWNCEDHNGFVTGTWDEFTIMAGVDPGFLEGVGGGQIYQRGSTVKFYLIFVINLPMKLK